MRIRVALFVAAVALLLPAAGPAQAPVEKLGTVNFTTSCAFTAQPQFNRAVALVHSFQFALAIEAFHTTLASDPSCAIAYRGIALSNWGNPFATGQKAAAQLEQGLKAVEQARTAMPRTERERAYIEAVAHLFTDTAAIDQRSRVLAYESAMAAVNSSYPQDTEAAIFYALAVAAAADPADKTYARQLKAGKILDTLYAKYPDHPGLAHYIIHAYDVPPLASRAIGAAQHYGEIAPATPHALHMPSHTFTRIGDWKASINANIASAGSARNAGQPVDELHASDYLVYAYLQTGQDSAAHSVVEAAGSIFSRFDPEVVIGGAGSPATAYFARAAIPARYALERHVWTEAAKLQVVPSPFPQADAITYFAQGLGAAHGNDRSGAHAAIDSLEQCREKLNKGNETYWVNQVEIQLQEVAAWLAFSDGAGEDALAKMRAAAELEDKTEKSAVTPGPLAPAREQLGGMLLELKRPSEAKKEFEATLTKEPNRFWALYGTAEAAKLAGDPQTAQIYFRKLLEIAGRSDQPGRPELAEARSEIARRP